MSFLAIQSTLLSIAILLTAILYLRECLEPLLEDTESVMLDSYLNSKRWMRREYGLVAFLVVMVFQGWPEVRWAVQKI